MHNNRYTDIVDPKVARLIVSRARRMRINREEIDDLQQRIVPMLAEFQFDEARSNGAAQSTVMTVVIDRQLMAHLRAKRRYAEHLKRMGSQSRALLSGRPIWPNHVTQPEPVDLRLDIEKAKVGLSDRDQQICDALSHGESQKAIAERLGIGRDTVARAISRIRDVFTQAGLKAWVDPDYDGEVERA